MVVEAESDRVFASGKLVVVEVTRLARKRVVKRAGACEWVEQQENCRYCAVLGSFLG